MFAWQEWESAKDGPTVLKFMVTVRTDKKHMRFLLLGNERRVNTPWLLSYSVFIVTTGSLYTVHSPNAGERGALFCQKYMQLE